MSINLIDFKIRFKHSHFSDQKRLIFFIFSFPIFFCPPLVIILLERAKLCLYVWSFVIMIKFSILITTIGFIFSPCSDCARFLLQFKYFYVLFSETGLQSFCLRCLEHFSRMHFSLLRRSIYLPFRSLPS